MSHKILKVLKKLNEHFPGEVGNSFIHKLRFPKALLNYMEEIKLEDMAGDAFILLINIFDEDTTPELMTVGFLDKLTGSLEHIEDEGTLHSLVSILVCLAPVFEAASETKNVEDNPVLQEFVKKMVCDSIKDQFCKDISRVQ